MAFVGLAAGIGAGVVRVAGIRAATVAALLAVAVGMADPVAAQAPTVDIPVTFSGRSMLSGQSFTVTGTLPGGAADAGRPLQLYEQRAPFPADYAVVSNGASGASGEFVFNVTPVRKAYWAVVPRLEPFTTPSFKTSMRTPGR